MTLSLKTLNHTAGNYKLWTLNYRHWLLPGETISSFTIVSSSTTLTVDTTSVLLGRELQFRLVGGVAGETPTLTVTVTTSKTETKIDTINVIVTSP